MRKIDTYLYHLIGWNGFLHLLSIRDVLSCLHRSLYGRIVVLNAGRLVEVSLRP